MSLIRKGLMVALALGAVANAAETAAPARLAQLTQQLEHTDYAVREAAFAALCDAGPAAAPLLTEMLKKGSPEAAWRAGMALEQIALGGDEAVLKRVQTTFEASSKSPPPALTTVIRELADRQHWYRHARAVEQIAKLGGTVQAAGEQVVEDFAIEVAGPIRIFEEVEEFLEPEGLALVEEEALEHMEELDLNGRLRLAGIDEPIEVSAIDKFKAEAAKALAPPELPFALPEGRLAEFEKAAKLLEGVELPADAEAPVGRIRVIADGAEPVDRDGVDVEVEAAMEGAVAIDILGMEEEDSLPDVETSVSIDQNWKGGDAGLAALKDVRGIQLVSLTQTPLTDAALTHLAELKELVALQLQGGNFTPAALVKLHRAKPNLQIIARSAAMMGISASGSPLKIDRVVEESPAAVAGLQRGDKLKTVDGVEVRDFVEVTLTLLAKKAGEKVRVVYDRDGQSHTADVTLKSRE